MGMDLAQLDTLKSIVQKDVKELQEVVNSTRQTVLDISSTLPNFIGQIREEIVSVKQAVSDVNVNVNYFKDTINAVELAQAKKEEELNKKEAYLVEKENILYNTKNTKNVVQK